MDPSFLGVWQVDQSKTIGLEDFAKVMGFSPEKTEKYKNLDYTVTISQDGEIYKIAIDFKGAVPSASYSLRLGEEIDYNTIDGQKAKLTLTVENGKTVESYYYAEKDLRWTVTRAVKGSVMTAVTRLGDATLTQILNKV
ncbi:unnamed protein product [Candidula unifasciata]|uniref:Uncharacterized protein n=1 Tax=Candidula unifasciata TaxID=100452 RepID=A0A8S3ZYV8_9EUPU|nr:unnamed protein product [Candidula unifasciata]